MPEDELGMWWVVLEVEKGGTKRRRTDSQTATRTESGRKIGSDVSLEWNVKTYDWLSGWLYLVSWLPLLYLSSSPIAQLHHHQQELPVVEAVRRGWWNHLLAYVPCNCLNYRQENHSSGRESWTGWMVCGISGWTTSTTSHSNSY